MSGYSYYGSRYLSVVQCVVIVRQGKLNIQSNKDEYREMSLCIYESKLPLLKIGLPVVFVGQWCF